MNIKQLKKRILIVLEKIESVEEIEESLNVINNPDHEYYSLFGNSKERDYDMNRYLDEISTITDQIHKELEFINEIK